MKSLIIILVIVFTSIILPQEQRKVLVEVFTNSHCPLCPPAHSSVDNYLQNSSNAENINYIFYHMKYPYPSDPLYQASSTDSDNRDLYYGPFGSTPKGFYDGTSLGSNYSGWGNLLDTRVAEESPFSITLSGTKEENNVNIKAAVLRSGEVSQSDLVIRFAVVEDVNYQGNNGIANHKNVMRKMYSSDGIPLSIDTNETKEVEAAFVIESSWNTNNLEFIVFIQSANAKEIFQSEVISYSVIDMTTGIEDNTNIPGKFELKQNYPNPFNPTTKIKYTIPTSPKTPLLGKERGRGEVVTLKVYDILGNEISTLLNENQSPGEYEIEFNAEALPSGIYFYRLQAGSFVRTKKMTVLK